MKGLARFEKKLPDFESRIERLIHRVADVLTDPNATRQDYAEPLRQLQDLNADVGSEASDALSEEIRERLEREFLARGMSPEDVEKLLNSEWKRFVDMAGRARKELPKARKFGKFAWLKLAAAVAACGAVGLAIHSGIRQGDAVNASLRQIRDLQTVQTLSMKVSMSRAEFAGLLQSLDLRLPPPPSPPAPAPPAPVAAVPPPVAAIPLPPAVKAVASVPVTVTVRAAPSSRPVQTTHTTLATVYRAVPRARRRIERYSRTPDRPFHGSVDVQAPWAGGPTVDLSW